MGWLFTHREKGISNLDWFRSEFGRGPGELLDMATKNGVAYGAYRTNEGDVFALVILTRWVRGEYHNYGWKDLDESMGPGEYDCPKRIFDLLTPLPPEKADPAVDGNWAAQWRAHVQERLNRPKVTKGMRLRWTFETWRGGPYGICEYIGGRGRNLFRTENGTLVRFTGWRNVPFEVIS